MDAADEGYCMIVRAKKAGNISKIGFRTGSINTGSTLDVRIETVSTSDGKPSGTLWDTDTNGAQAVTTGDSNTWFETTLTASATVAVGDVIAIVIKQPNTSFGSAQISRNGNIDQLKFPYTGVNTGVSPAINWLVTVTSPVLALGYDDSTWSVPQGCLPYNAVTSTTVGTATTPNSMGLRFQLPYDARITGCWTLFTNNGGDVTIKLVESSYHKTNGSGILASASMDKDLVGLTNPCASAISFDSVTLTAGTNYRLVLESTNNTTFLDYSVHSAEILAACAGGSNFHLTSASSPTGDSDWTNYNNSSDGFRVPFMGLIIDGIDIPAGGGGGSAGQRIYAY